MTDTIDLVAELARIDRDLAAIHKRRPQRPWLLILASLIAFAAVVVARLPEIMQAFR